MQKRSHHTPEDSATPSMPVTLIALCTYLVAGLMLYQYLYSLRYLDAFYKNLITLAKVDMAARSLSDVVDIGLLGVVCVELYVVGELALAHVCVDLAGAAYMRVSWRIFHSIYTTIHPK